MAKHTKVKIIIIAVAVLFVAGMMVGIMALAGVFRSDKAEAMELLWQMKEKLSWSSVNEYTGVDEIAGDMLQKGGEVDIKLSDMQMDKMNTARHFIGEEYGVSALFGSVLGMDWSDYVLEMNTQTDMDAGRTSYTAALSKGENAISITRCQDEDECWVAMPELLEGKVFHFSLEEQENGQQSATGASMQPKDSEKDVVALFSDLKGCFYSSLDTLQESISCDKIRKRELAAKGDEGYRIIIPQDTVNSVLSDFADVFCKQENETIKAIGELLGTWKVSGEIRLMVYGEDNYLRKIELSVPVGKEIYQAELSFKGEKGNAEAEFHLGGTLEDIPVSVTVKKTDKKDKTCESSLDIQVMAQKEQIVHMEWIKELTPESDSYVEKGTIQFDEEEEWSVEAHGSIKDLKQGTCVSYILDEVTISSGGAELLTMALDLRIASKEGTLELPRGEIVEISQDTTEEEMEQYTIEMQTKGMQILDKMGIFSRDGLFKDLQGEKM